MTYVLDASAVIDLLVRTEAGLEVQAHLARDPDTHLASLAHLDAEVFAGLARLFRAGELEAEEVARLLHHLAQLPMIRLPITEPLLDAVWRMRDNVSARDALYVAAARAAQARLLTTDQRLARSVPDLATGG